MSKRNWLFALILITPMPRLGAETILVAPLVVYDKDSNVVEQDINPSETIYEKISKYWFEGLATFKSLSKKKYGEIYTSFDANRCCAAEEAGFILFGYVQKNEGNYIANVKLYDYSLKKISREFYSGDDILHYERMIEDLSSNIIAGLEETTGLDRSRTVQETTRDFEVKLPVSVFYWTPVDGDWASKMTGIAGGNIGVEIYPSQPRIVIKQMLLDFSARPEFSYSFAIGKNDVYPLNYHAVSFVLPLCAHLHFNMRNSVYLGTGAYYEIELLKAEQKHEDEELLHQNMFGLESAAGYEFKAGELINILAEVRIDFHFNKDTFIAIKPSLGMSFNLYREKK